MKKKMIGECLPLEEGGFVRCNGIEDGLLLAEFVHFDGTYICDLMSPAEWEEMEHSLYQRQQNARRVKCSHFDPKNLKHLR